MDREQATWEVRTSQDQVGNTTVERQTISESASAPTGIVAQRIVWYITGAILTLLLLRLVLQILGANQGNGFVDFIYALSGVFAAPFFGMFSYTPSYGASMFEPSTLVAILIYALLGWGIAKLFTLGSNHPEA